ncbi:zinc-ribbon domain-containing protein [Schlesneria paludicola]|uniref:zinc-ribbon domain-containing protein n=1 Tax=Schlesneria paludicola TaxID=360056 RepID=UPI00192B8C2C|nr:zinc-ribbon domain-containing protein [Schlesneria paludicola]
MKKERHDSRIPAGAIPADLSQQVPNNSYSPPPKYYVDTPFVCVDCRSEEVWAASQQKWYYEVAKGSLYATAVRCLDCRRKRSARYANGDPHPVKHLGTLMKRLFEAIKPILIEAGFLVDRKSAISLSRKGQLEFSRSDEIVVVSYQRPDGNPRLVAESVSTQAGYLILTCVNLTPNMDVPALIHGVATSMESHFHRETIQ